jgi:phage gp36-like protein
MSYLTLTEAKQALARVIKAYNDENGNLDETYLETSINEVEAIVNASISRRYAIPATSTAAVAFLRSLVISILKYNSYAIIPNVEVPKSVQGSYDNAMKMVHSLSRQIISLPGETENTTSPARGSYLVVEETTNSIPGY